MEETRLCRISFAGMKSANENNRTGHNRQSTASLRMLSTLSMLSALSVASFA